MEFPVPQFIEIEEKILGPLNLKQTLYIVGAGGLLFILYFFVEIWLFVVLAALIMGIACAFAFIKIGGRTLSQFLISVISYSFKPRIFIWKKTEEKIEEAEKIQLEKPEFGIPGKEKIEAQKRMGTRLQKISRRIDLGVGK